MSQPKWKCIANLGDINPIEHGGFFVFIDKTGVYPPEVEKLVEPCEDGPNVWTVYRFVMDPCTYQDGILSDNQYHPDHSAWFAKDLDGICSYVDVEKDELIAKFCSDDAQERAYAWECVGSYFGFHELDTQPLRLTRKEVWGRYNSRIKALA